MKQSSTESNNKSTDQRCRSLGQGHTDQILCFSSGKCFVVTTYKTRHMICIYMYLEMKLHTLTCLVTENQVSDAGSMGLL